MLMGVRMYATEQNARAAAAKLVAEGMVAESSVSVFTPGSGEAEKVVQAAVREGRLPVGYMKPAAEALEKGQCIVSIPLPLMGAAALKVMDSFESLDIGPEPAQYSRNPAPFSDAFGIPLLIKSKRRVHPTDGRDSASAGSQVAIHHQHTGEQAMLMGVRMYATEQRARDAAAALVAEEMVSEKSISIFTSDSGAPVEVVQAAVRERRLPVGYSRLAVEALENGQAVLSIPLPLQGAYALEIMDSFESLDVGPEPAQHRRDPSPLSDLFGLPVLTKNSRGSATLLSGDRPILGMFPLLKKSESKDSSFGMPLLRKESKDSSFGMPLLSKKGTPLSSMLGLKTLTGKKR
jgi:hypothetical protein